MKIQIKNKLKKIISIFDIKITKDYKIIPLFKKNVFNTNYKKNVLLSYIIDPFFFKNNFSHTNFDECYTVAKIFDELGFCVDVIDLTCSKKIDYSKYDIIYGMGAPLEKSFYCDNKLIKRIFYATGCNPLYSNTETLSKMRDFYLKNKIYLLSSARYIETSFNLQLFLSDIVIVLGNDFVLNTYKMFDQRGISRYSNLNAFFYDVYDIDLSKKDFSNSKKHFLWFGSSGLIHKGLDLLIDVFCEREDIFLHICGASDNEKEFFNHYNDILLKSKNIINHGFINIKSEKFKKIMDQCAFTILPSVSEGGSPSVLNAIANGGLIPIITRSSGLDIDNFGILIDKPERISVNNAINEALLLNDSQLFNMSMSAKNNIRKNYTYFKYKKDLAGLIKKLL